MAQMRHKKNYSQIGLKFKMAQINWKTIAQIEEEKRQEEANKPLPTEQQLSNMLLNQTITEMKMQQIESSNANILLTLAMNGIK